MNNGTRSARPSRGALLEVIQAGESHVYALVTRFGAIKIGVTRDLAHRHHSMKFGGTERYLAFIPGGYEDEQAIHHSLPDLLRIAPHREYYYPLYEWVLPPINDMRDAMRLPPLNRRDLPRPGVWARQLPVADWPDSWPRPATWGLAV